MGHSHRKRGGKERENHLPQVQSVLKALHVFHQRAVGGHRVHQHGHDRPLPAHWERRGNPPKRREERQAKNGETPHIPREKYDGTKQNGRRSTPPSRSCCSWRTASYRHLFRVTSAHSRRKKSLAWYLARSERIMLRVNSTSSGRASPRMVRCNELRDAARPALSLPGPAASFFWFRDRNMAAPLRVRAPPEDGAGTGTLPEACVTRKERGREGERERE